jgi:BTB/POZ domain
MQGIKFVIFLITKQRRQLKLAVTDVDNGHRNLCFTIDSQFFNSHDVEFELSVKFGAYGILSFSEMKAVNNIFRLNVQVFPSHYGLTAASLKIDVKTTFNTANLPSNFIFLDNSTKNNIVTTVASMLDDPQFSDFKFIINEKEFKVHKCILAAASDAFAKIFKVNKLYWKISDIDEATFGHLLRFIYSGKVPDNLSEIAMKMFEAADYFKINDLKEMSSKKIHDKLSAENALETYNWAFVYDLEVLKTKAWELVKR